MGAMDLDEAAARAKVAALALSDDATRRKVICALIGHSRIVTGCFGYINCARCEEQIGDTLAGCFDMTGKVLVGHDCPTCEENRKALTWRDTWETPPLGQTDGRG